MYIYQRKAWPNFTWEHEATSNALLSLRFQQGKLLGKMENLGFEIQEEAILESLTNEVIKSSEIEGEKLNNDEVRSSIARHLGLEYEGVLPADRHVDGIVEMDLDATQNFNKKLNVH